MNNHGLRIRAAVLLLVFFLFSCGKVVTVVESPSPPVAEARKVKEVPLPEIKPPVIVPQAEKKEAVPVAGPDRNAVGCLLPLSGVYGDYGNRALDAILLAAGIFDGKKKTPWKIVAEDSRGSAEQINSAIARLVQKENIIALIAVAGTTEAAVFAKEAGKWKVPLILITAKEGITDENDYVFQNFLTPTQQMEALARYVVSDLNHAIFAILYPQDDYGTEMMKIFRTEVERMGGRVERAVPYGKKQADFTAEIDKITKNSVSAAKKANAENPETKVPVSIDFEALFIPDSSLRVKMMAAQLAFHDVKGFPLLGTSLWNVSDLLKKGAEYLEGAVFPDSFFLSSFYPEVNDFIDVYYTAYGREPENIDALSYDTMGMIISVLRDENIKTHEQVVAGLKRLENYQGATGNTSFAGNRAAKKTAFILRVKSGKLEQVK
ncbi:MAG TPA: penicillin-binding protein activator [Smithellaceae bacterium]|nr:penicillin-binding protein activator [Smithellaceae bacterium]